MPKRIAAYAVGAGLIALTFVPKFQAPAQVRAPRIRRVVVHALRPPSTPRPVRVRSYRAPTRLPVVAAPVEASASCGASYFSGAEGFYGPLVGYYAASKTAPGHSRWVISYAGRSVVVAVLDKGPFVAGRCWDLSPGAFEQLAPLGAGVIEVTYRPV